MAAFAHTDRERLVVDRADRAAVADIHHIEDMVEPDHMVDTEA